jgi:hypothetical protein
MGETMDLIRFSRTVLCLSLLTSATLFAKEAGDSWKVLDSFLVKNGIIEPGADPRRAELVKALWAGGDSADAAMTAVYAAYIDGLGNAVNETQRREFAKQSIDVLKEQGKKVTAAAKSLDKNGTFSKLKENEAKTDEAKIYFVCLRFSKQIESTVGEMKKKAGLK